MVKTWWSLLCLLLLAAPATADPLNLTPPTGVVAKQTSPYEVLLSWDAVPNATSYNVYRSGVFIANTSNTTYQDNAGSFWDVYWITSMVANLESTPSAPAFAEPFCWGIGTGFPYVIVNPDACCRDAFSQPNIICSNIERILQSTPPYSQIIRYR